MAQRLTHNGNTDTEIMNRATPTAREESRATTTLPMPMRETESSGQFFNRMTGRAQQTTNTIDLDLPFVGGIQRSATAGGRSAEASSSSHESNTIHSGGNTRMPWNTLYDRSPPPLRRSQHASEDRTQAPTNNATSASQCARRSILSDIAYAIDHHNAATAGKIQKCVEQLRTLGFGSDGNDGLGRLVVYAQVAEGDLSNAIDLIDEEQQAYSQWH